MKTIASSLRRQGLRAKASRRFSPVSYREHGLPVSENLLKQDFNTSGPNQKWSGDITYLRTDEGWLYLAVVIDLWSRANIGRSMSSLMTASLACDALQMALWRRKRPKYVIVHSDRGGQYCSADYQALLKRHNLHGSMSARGNCFNILDEKTRAIFGRSYAATPDKLVEQLKKDEAIAEADTLLLTVPNQLGVDYNVHVIESILKHVAPAMGWRD